MEIYDISKELLSAQVYPGDLAPARELTMSMLDGASCNVSNLSMCAHNGTHMDAPFHFYADGKTIEHIDLTKCVGACTVVELSGRLSADDLQEVIKSCQPRLLIKGDIQLTKESAILLREAKIELVGIESQSVDCKDTAFGVHWELLREEIVVLEGLVLLDVPAGDYFLVAAPIKIAGSDGSPCRPILIKA